MKISGPWGREGTRATSETLKTSSRRTVETSAGPVMIGRLSLEARIRLRDLLQKTSGDEKRAEDLADVLKQPSRVVAKLLPEVLIAGVISPRLVADPQLGSTPNDFECDDQLLLLREILALCNTPVTGGRTHG